jgi:hypothetical protein
MNILVKLITAIVLALLCACSTAQIKATVENKAAQDIAVQISPVAIPDLQNQKAQALAATPPDTYGAKCADVSIQLLGELTAAQKASASGGKCPSPTDFYNPALKADGTPIGCQFGVATSIEAMRLAAQTPATPFRLPPYWVEGCSVVYTDLRISALQFLNKIGLDVGKFGFGGAILP